MATATQMNYLAIDVEITIMNSTNGVPYSIFDPSNPFVRRNCYQPLPFWGIDRKFNYDSTYSEVYWVIEEELTIPSLDLKKAFNCFNQIASTGASYSIKLCADVPDNNNPTNLPPETGSETGHTFIVVTKKNGAKSVTQVFGFYAQRHPGYLFPFRPMNSVIKNNQLREINASIEMGLTDVQFEQLRKKAYELANQKYRAASYNCTNFGMDLFNSVRANPLTIDSYTVYLPNNNNAYGTSEPNTHTIEKTPQMLFKKLQEIKASKGAESSNIIIDQTNKTKAPISSGECN